MRRLEQIMALGFERVLNSLDTLVCKQGRDRAGVEYCRINARDLYAQWVDLVEQPYYAGVPVSEFVIQCPDGSQRITTGTLSDLHLELGEYVVSMDGVNLVGCRSAR